MVGIMLIYRDAYDETYRQGYRLAQGVVARRMIMGETEKLEAIAELTELEIEEVKMEQDRLCTAWELMLNDYPDGEILKTGIAQKEIEELRAMKRERRRLIFRALDNDLTPDVAQSIFCISTAEMEYWWDAWCKARKEGKYA